jgi:hypothetical protein
MNGVSSGYLCCRLQLSATIIEYPMTVRPNNTLELAVNYRRRIVLAMDCGLADAQSRLRWKQQRAFALATSPRTNLR